MKSFIRRKEILRSIRRKEKWYLAASVEDILASWSWLLVASSNWSAGVVSELVDDVGSKLSEIVVFIHLNKLTSSFGNWSWRQYSRLRMLIPFYWQALFRLLKTGLKLVLLALIDIYISRPVKSWNTWFLCWSYLTISWWLVNTQH